MTCEADSYYPLDVEIGWYMQDPAVAGQRVGAPLPEKLQNVLLSSHKHNTDKTYSLTAFFYLQAALKHSGREFTCRVSHKSLRVPIKKSFTLTVEGEWRRAELIRLLGLFVMMILIMKQDNPDKTIIVPHSVLITQFVDVLLIQCIQPFLYSCALTPELSFL